MITVVVLAISLWMLSRYRYQELLKKQQKKTEMAEKRIAVMLSQMQPHFICNTLNTISALCQQDPQRAEELVAHFAGFLRGIIDSLTLQEAIPFVQEKEHLECYLAIEKMRFQDTLNIECSYEVVDFLLPALTLQPIVENAIRHGIRKKKGGGTVKITTWEEETEFLLQVADDGAGFTTRTQEKDGHGHTGLANVLSRLQAQCEGDIHIKSVPEKGTLVTITIPKQRR